MLRPYLLIAATLGVLAASVTARAETILFATLTNAGESAPTVPTLVGGGARPASFGTAMFVLNDAQTAMSFTASIFNIDFTGSQTADPNDNLTNAHIHASPTVTPTTNAPVRWGFIGTPFNNDTPNDTIVTPFATGVGAWVSGTWDAPEGNSTTLLAQLANILSEHSYMNFHTVQFGAGEIRGTLFVASEPSSLALLGASLLGLLGFSLRRNPAR